MGQTTRTTKLLLDFSGRSQGGANLGKREHLTATVEILNAARRFYLAFFLAHPDKLTERVEVSSKKTGEVREGLISADNLLTWAEFQTIETASHPDPLPAWSRLPALSFRPGSRPVTLKGSFITDRRGGVSVLVCAGAAGRVRSLREWAGKVAPVDRHYPFGNHVGGSGTSAEGRWRKFLKFRSARHRSSNHCRVWDNHPLIAVLLG